jgi:MOSC domain-containing protein YiiM
MRAVGKGRVEAIYIAAEHGQLPHAVEAVRAIAGKGLEGNRYFDTGRPEQELTLIEAEQIERAAVDDGLEVDPAATWRNVLTRGVDLNSLVSKRFRVGELERRGSSSASRARRSRRPRRPARSRCSSTGQV